MAGVGSASIAEAIRQRLDRLTPTERRPALVLLGNYPVAGLETVAELAKRSRVSGPTVLRLVSKLGFAGYPDFQRALRDELELRLLSPLTKARLRRPGKATPDFLDEFAETVCAGIARSLRDVPRSHFDRTVELLADARRTVTLIGGRFTSSLALQLYQHLREMRPRVQLVEGQTATWVEHLLDIGRNDVLVAFDIRRYQEDVVRFAEAAAAQGAVVVLFTDQWLSPIAAAARHVFAVRTGAPSAWESLAAMDVLIEALVARLNDRSWTEIKGRMERLETLRSRLTRR